MKHNPKVLITGANGMVARAAIRHCSSIGDDVAGLTRDELDITDRDAVRESVERFRWDMILNCAAYTDVDGAETHEDACFKVNALGVENLAAAASEFGARFVTISTDYIFDGQKTGFYSTQDTPNPKGVYAKSKLEGERLAVEANPASVIVRSGWIFGYGGTNYLSIMHRLLNEGKTIRAIEDSFGTPTFADDLAVQLRQLASMGKAGIFHVTNAGEGTSYFGFANAVCEVGGFDRENVIATSSRELSRAAARPGNSKLQNSVDEASGLLPLRNWKKALREFIELDQTDY